MQVVVSIHITQNEDTRGDAAFSLLSCHMGRTGMSALMPRSRDVGLNIIYYSHFSRSWRARHRRMGGLGRRRRDRTALVPFFPLPSFSLTPYKSSSSLLSLLQLSFLVKNTLTTHLFIYKMTAVSVNGNGPVTELAPGQ